MPLIKETDPISDTFIKAGCMKMKVIPAHALFYERFVPQGYYYLLNGKVKIMKQIPGGGEKLMGIISSGQFAGIQDFFSGLPYKYTAIALESSEVYFISSEKHTELIKEPNYSEYFLTNSDIWQR
jgi:CRP-like cAMP-binding protein